MPWPKDHKARTRQKIVEAAAAAFRARGVDGVNLEDVMARAGLTHGGFYAHFASKDDLLREALGHASRQTVEGMSGGLDKAPSAERLASVVDAYLSPAHVAHPELGCPVATLGPELARTRGPARATLAAGVKDRLKWMRELIPAGEVDALSDAQIVGALACMVGGVVLARTVSEKDAPDVLRACRAFARAGLKSSKRSSLRRSRAQTRSR